MYTNKRVFASKESLFCFISLVQLLKKHMGFKYHVKKKKFNGKNVDKMLENVRLTLTKVFFLTIISIIKVFL